MRMRRAKDRGMQRIWSDREIVGIPSTAGEERAIFQPLNGLSHITAFLWHSLGPSHNAKGSRHTMDQSAIFEKASARRVFSSHAFRGGE